MRLFNLLVILFFSTSLYSIEIPINVSMHIQAQIGEFTIIEFPFKLKGVQSATFTPKYKIVKVKETTILDTVKNDVIKKTTVDPITGQEKEIVTKTSGTKGYITIKKGANTLTFYPKKYGILKLVVWGYNHPINLKIEVSKEGISSYYEVIDYSTKKNESVKFESVPHEEVIVKLIRHLYNHKTPSGYTASNGKHVFSDQNISFVQNVELVGDLYTADEYTVTNNRSEPTVLYEELFSSIGVYGVGIEEPELGIGESTRLFIVHSNDTDSE